MKVNKERLILPTVVCTAMALMGLVVLLPAPVWMRIIAVVVVMIVTIPCIVVAAARDRQAVLDARPTVPRTTQRFEFTLDTDDMGREFAVIDYRTDHRHGDVYTFDGNSILLALCWLKEAGAQLTVADVLGLDKLAFYASGRDPRFLGHPDQAEKYFDTDSIDR